MAKQNDLLVAIRQITRAIDLNSKRLQKETGLTASQMLILQALGENDRAKPSDLARVVHLSQATVTSIVDRLVKADLVARERREDDRRVVEVVLTEHGRDRLHAAPTLLQEGFLSQFDALELWEQSLLVSSIQRLATMMNADILDAAPILELGELTPKDPA